MFSVQRLVLLMVVQTNFECLDLETENFSNTKYTETQTNPCLHGKTSDTDTIIGISKWRRHRTRVQIIKASFVPPPTGNI